MLHNRPTGKLTVVKTEAAAPMPSAASVDVVVVDEAGVHWSFTLSRFSHDMELRNPNVQTDFPSWCGSVSEILRAKHKDYWYYGTPERQLLQDHYLAGLDPTTHIDEVIKVAKAARDMRWAKGL